MGGSGSGGFFYQPSGLKTIFGPVDSIRSLQQGFGAVDFFFCRSLTALQTFLALKKLITCFLSLLMCS